MFERFKRTDDGGTTVADRPVAHGNGTTTAVARPLDRERMHAVRARQREQYGGINWGAAFFGWLVAIGMSAILVALLSAAGAAVGLTPGPTIGAGEAPTVGIVGGALLVIALMVAYYCGGYVAGRMSRFDAGRQGLAVWIIGLLMTIVAGAAGAALGTQYNVLSRLDLPRIPIDEGALATGGLIALAAIVVGTLLAAIAGGRAGWRYHRRLDRAGF